jgi:glutamate-1-semialdehyde 2,1-aminomutase
MFTPFYTEAAVRDYQSAKQADVAQFADWFRRLREKGVLLPPSQFEAAFVSVAHDDEAMSVLESAFAS